MEGKINKREVWNNLLFQRYLRMHQLQKIITLDLTVLQEFQVKSDYVCPWTKVLPHVTMHPFIPLSYLHRWGKTALIVNTDRLVTNLFQKATFPSPALRSWETRPHHWQGHKRKTARDSLRSLFQHTHPPVQLEPVEYKWNRVIPM